MAGSDLLSNGKLAQLDQARWSVIEEIALGQRAEPRQTFVLCR